MKKMKTTWTIVLMAIATTVLTSCLDDENNDYANIFPNAIVTLKNNSAEGTFYMQLDDSTILVPTNLKQSPYGDKEVRAFVNYKQEVSPNKSSYDVHVNWIDTIRTKNMDLNLGPIENIDTYGNDPLEIINDWATVVEDGYLTLRFRTYFGYGKTHYLHLVHGENPYEITLYHNANGDYPGQMRDGYIAFRLNNLPKTDKETVELTLKWNSFSGEKSTKFNYRIRH